MNWWGTRKRPGIGRNIMSLVVGLGIGIASNRVAWYVMMLILAGLLLGALWIREKDKEREGA